jgi:hypothetical protein
MHLALADLFRARWSADVHEEWIESLLRKRPDLSREKLDRTRALMDEHAPDALVTGYHDLITGLKATRSRRPACADFPALALEPFGIEAQHPDDFILHLLGLAPGRVAAAAEDHRKSLKNPPKTIDEYLATLEAQGLTQTVSVLRQFMF